MMRRSAQEVMEGSNAELITIAISIRFSESIASGKIIEASITIDNGGPVGFSTGNGDIQASGRKNNR